MGLSRSAKAAVRQAEAEGLTLMRSDRCSTGYKGVVFISSKSTKPYQARMWRGKFVYLGYFGTPEEAALCYARTPEGRAAAPPEPPAQPPMTAEEALRQAEAEGLTLLKSASSSTGYKGVAFNRKSSLTKPYMATVWRHDGAKQVTLGYYPTPEEAALNVARSSAAQPAAPQLPSTSSRKRKVRSEEQSPDMPADVVVILDGYFVESTTFE